ncbi:MAG: thermonuclease family protein [Candidatus Hydrogenedentes bacterium]|nr:thermonuclease family protein [Candidatus Hydrogenedentota bacterium]
MLYSSGYRIGCAGCLVLAGMGAATGSWAEEVMGKVVSIQEGDLLGIRIGEGTRTCRIFGVDCPETGQDYFEEAVKQMRAWVEDKSVTLEKVAVDSLGMDVVRVKLEDGVDLGRLSLDEGLAWWDYGNAPKEAEYRKAMARAMAAKKGLWTAETVLSPSDYRKSHNLPPVVYTTEPEEAKSESAPVPEKVTIKAKGDPKPAAPKLAMPADADYMGLIMKHQPRIATNAAGEAIGLTATDIMAIPGAAQLGLQNGDVVSSVNGIAIRSEAQVMGLVGQLQGADRLELSVIRGGQPTTVVIPLR